MLRLVVAPREQGLRLDSFLATATDLSRRRARNLIADGLVARNGRLVRVQSRTVAAADVVELLLDDVASVQVRRALPTQVRFLHEDTWLVVVDKPAGVLSQPISNRRSQELSLDQQVALVLAERDGRRPFLHMLHRLDRLTSGAVLMARSRQASKALADAWARGAVERRYLALVEGNPEFETVTVTEPIARDHDHPWRFRVADTGSPACTEVVVRHRLAGGGAVVGCLLHSGRTHQVRVHLAELGHPVLGDTLYGANRRSTVTRPLLHAHALDLPHPCSGDLLHVISPLPDDFRGELGDIVLAELDADRE